jgi:tetratricopeptide (TPR) repeat protein
MSWPVTIVSICILTLCAGCAASMFPNVRPVPKPAKEWDAQRRAHEYYIKGRECDRHGLFQMAEHFYELANGLDPSSQTIKEILVQRYVFSSRFTQAILFIKGDKKDSELSRADKNLCANIYLRMGHYTRATELLESIKDKQKEDYQTIGLLYESMDNIPMALAGYRGFLAKDPSSLEMTLKVGALLVRQKKFGAAESLYVASERYHNQNPRLFNAIGEANLAKGDTAQAFDFFKMAVTIDSSSIDGLRNLAQMFVRKGEYLQAISCYEKLRGNDSVGGVFDKTLALLYYYGKQPEKSKEILRNLLSSDIDDAELHFYLGLIYVSQDSVDAARTELSKTITIRATFTDAWLQLCYLELKQKDYAAALRTARRFTEKMPESGESWRTLGYVYNIRKEYQDAIPLLKKAAVLDSLDAFAWYELGSALERTKDKVTAAYSFRRVLAIRPNDDAASNYLGYMWAEQGIMLDSAKTLVKSALDRDPVNGAYLDSYAWIFFKLGDLDSAQIYLEKAMRQIKDDAVMYSHYGDILLVKGSDREALCAFIKSIEIDATSEEGENVKVKIRLLEERLGGIGKVKKRL